MAALKVVYDLTGATTARRECRARGGHDFPAAAETTPGEHTCARCGASMTVREVRRWAKPPHGISPSPRSG